MLCHKLQKNSLLSPAPNTLPGTKQVPNKHRLNKGTKSHMLLSWFTSVIHTGGVIS